MVTDALPLEPHGHVPGNWRECPRCGLLSALPAMTPERVAECSRCGGTLWRMRRMPFRFPLACALAGLLFYVFMVVAPFLEISAYGRFQLARLDTGPLQLEQQHFQLLGFVVLATTMIFPGIKVGILLITLMGVETRLLPARLLKAIFRWYRRVNPWAMMDVYLLGFMVAYTRLIAIANVHLDTALYALIGLMVMLAAADGSMDDEAVWRTLDEQEQESDRRHHTVLLSEPPLTGADGVTELIGCHCCHLVSRARHGDRCRRCHGKLHRRKSNSVARSWALLISAAMLYVPANIYPVMHITQLAKTDDLTIMGGIIELFDYGLWPLALLVFGASITIPLLKLLTLGYMLLQTQIGSGQHLLGRTRAYRVVDFVGRWSMIDIFMISILVALVRFGQFANISTDIGAPCFAAVVVLTMFAVEAFDPRLMWDAGRHELEHEAMLAPTQTDGLRATA